MTRRSMMDDRSRQHAPRRRTPEIARPRSRKRWFVASIPISHALISLRRQISLLVWLVCLSAATAADAGLARRAPENPGVAPDRLLTTTREIRALLPEEALRRHPVRIRGIVTGFRSYYDSGYFVMDDTGPIFVALDASLRGRGQALQVGQVLDIEGLSDPGNYAPQIRELRRTIVGQVMLPPPPRLTYEQMASGREDCQVAEIEGIVRRVTPTGLILAMGEGRVDVTCSAHATRDLDRLVDARVRLRGVVCGRFNQKRQWFGARFTVSSLDGFVVEKPAPENPFAAPAHSISALLQWELNQAGRHRVKVHGVVTHFQPGVALFIREGALGLQIRTSETQTLAPGDVVEVLGFPALGTYSAVLEDAVFRPAGRATGPLPFPAAPAQLLRGEWDASLVSVQGVLLESVRQQGAEVLVMQAGDIIFHAPLGVGGSKPPGLPAAGSLLELTGICVVAETTIDGAKLSPLTFSLLLRSPADIRIVQEPPWWSARRLWQALGAISLAALGILSWVWLLRRQVRAQTTALKDQTQREAILEERTRIAQELHDTLDQELTGISLQLNAAVSRVRDEPVSRQLDVVHRLLKRSQSEVRRSVWDLRRPALESGGLGAALDELAEQLRSDSTATFEVSVRGPTRPLLALVEHHLLRIAAEAMTNAFRHACANRVRVELCYDSRAVRLIVTDDGRGFIADEAPGHAIGHFGLIGMRERSRKIGAAFALQSTPGCGTRVEIGLQEGHLNGKVYAARQSNHSETP